MSMASTVVTTAGNSNGFHLESTHSSIRGKVEGEVEREAKAIRKKRNSQGFEKKAGCVDLHVSINVC